MQIKTFQFTEEIQVWLVSYLAELLEIEPDEVDVTISFDRFGLDSSAAACMAGDLEEWLEYEVEPTIMYDYNTIESLAKHLSEIKEQLTKIDRGTPVTAGTVVSRRCNGDSIQRVELEKNQQTLSTDVKEIDLIEVEL